MKMKGLKVPGFEMESFGSRHGELLTKAYYHTLKDMIGKIDDNGFYNVSQKNTPYYDMAKDKFIKYGAFYRQAWSRDTGRAIVELAHLGVLKSRKAAEWFAKHPSGTPKRWCRIMYPDGHGGDDNINICSKGDLENDGHGLVMLGIFSAWKYLGDKSWLKRVIGGYRTGQDWIRLLSEKSTFHDLLYTISECSDHVLGGYDVYSNSVCAQALETAAMLEQAEGGRSGPLSVLSKRLRDSMYRHLRNPDGKRWLLGRLMGGGILDYQRYTWVSFDTIVPCDLSGWQFGPLALAADGTSYSPLTDMDGKFLKVCENTLREYLKANEKYMKANKLKYFGFYGNFPRDPAGKFGAMLDPSYQHGPGAQCLLLLDEMNLADAAIKTMALGCDNPHFGKELRYVVPQRFHVKGDKFVGNGDVGNVINAAEVMKMFRLVIGADDNGRNLRLLPRLPEGWRIRIDKYHVAMIRGRSIRRGNISYELVHKDGRITFRGRLDRDMGKVQLRLGPLPKGVPDSRITSSPKGKVIKSGDSKWVVFDGMHGRELSAQVSTIN